MHGLSRILPAAAAAASVLLASCASVLPVDRPATSSVLELGGVRVRSTGPVRMKIAPFLFDAAFLPAGAVVEAGGKVLYVDPVLPRPTEAGFPRADYVLLTHDHIDHYDPPTLKALADAATVVLCPLAMADRVARDAGHVPRGLAPGQAFDDGVLKATTYPSYNFKPVFLWINAHPRKAGFLAYRFEFGGAGFFHPGDTDAVPELDAAAPVDLVFLPIEGGSLSMSTAEAAALARRLRARVAVPVHRPLDGEGIPALREGLAGSETAVEILE